MCNLKFSGVTTFGKKGLQFWTLNFLSKVQVPEVVCSIETYRCQFHQRHVTRKKLPKQHSYEKFARLTLMKLMA
jgi:hypothetical protein